MRPIRGEDREKLERIMGQLIGAMFFLVDQLPDTSGVNRPVIRRALNKIAEYWDINNTLIRAGEDGARDTWLPK